MRMPTNLMKLGEDYSCCTDPDISLDGSHCLNCGTPMVVNPEQYERLEQPRLQKIKKKPRFK